MKKSKFTLLIMDIVMLIVLVVAEQATKYFAVLHLKNQPPISLIPGALELRYLENRGAAFGMLQNQEGLFNLCCGYHSVYLCLYSYENTGA